VSPATGKERDDRASRIATIGDRVTGPYPQVLRPQVLRVRPGYGAAVQRLPTVTHRLPGMAPSRQ